MISISDATRQASRLAAQPKFAEFGDTGFDEWVRVLRQHAENYEHGERAVTAWIDGHRWLPTCAELIEMLEATPAAVQKSKQNFACQFCKGAGFEPIMLLVTYLRHPSGAQKQREEQEIDLETAKRLAKQVDGHSQIVASAVKPCRCDYGQGLRTLRLAMAAQREEKLHAAKAKRQS